jgi:class 3 adenylate cyclase
MPGRQADRDRVLATVLFTDIVASTERAAQVGDAAWRDLVARHHAQVRRELRRFGGREQDTAGDGFFATFERPVAALRCAAAILGAAAPLGLVERAAVHTGEVERMEGKLGGIAVHAAARLLALAGPGEVLLSATTRELVAGAGLRFADRGTQALKGLPEPVHVYALEDPASLAAQTVTPVAAGATRLRLATVTGGVAVVAVLALVIAAFASRGVGSEPGRSGSPSGSSSGSLAATSPRSSATVADFPGNLPPGGAIAPGRYLLPTLRGGVVLTVAEPYWTNWYNAYWYPSSYPDTSLRFLQEPPPATDVCGSPAPWPIPSSGIYDAWVTWFTHHPALSTSSPTRRLFGTTSATELDTKVIAAKVCPSTGQGTVGLDRAGVPIISEDRLNRVYVVDSPEPFLVVLEAPTQQQLEDAAAQVEPMLMSLRLEP